MLTVQWLRFKFQIEKISGYVNSYKLNQDGMQILINNTRSVLSIVDYHQNYENPSKELVPHLKSCYDWLRAFIQEAKRINNMTPEVLKEYKKELEFTKDFVEKEYKSCKIKALKVDKQIKLKRASI